MEIFKDHGDNSYKVLKVCDFRKPENQKSCKLKKTQKKL